MDPLALGTAVAIAGAVLFAAIHIQRQRGSSTAADERIHDLHRPSDASMDVSQAVPWRRTPTSVPVLALIFARGTRGPEMEEALAQAGMELRPGAFILIQALIAFSGGTAALLIGGPTAFALVIALPLSVIGWYLPRAYLTYKTVRRLEEMDRQLVELLSLLASSVRSGFSILQGFDSASSRVGPPLQVEVTRVLNDVRMGQRMDDSLRAWVQRVPSISVRLMVTAMIVQRSAGGNLGEVLDNLAQTMRERVELKHQVNALTAYSRLSARVVAVYPVAIVGLLTMLNPDLYSRLWTQPAGWVLLGFAFVMNVIAFLVMRKVAQVEY